MFFNRVHFVSLTFSHFHFIPPFTFAILVNYIEDGHICRPQIWSYFNFFRRKKDDQVKGGGGGRIGEK